MGKVDREAIAVNGIKAPTSSMVREICPICREEIRRADRVSWLQFGHYAHSHCMATWLGQATTCLICRRTMQ